MPQKEHKVPDIYPSYTTISIRFVNGDWKPVNLDLRAKDKEETKVVETDNDGRVEMTVKGSSVNVMLIGESETE